MSRVGFPGRAQFEVSPPPRRLGTAERSVGVRCRTAQLWTSQRTPTRWGQVHHGAVHVIAAEGDRRSCSCAQRLFGLGFVAKVRVRRVGAGRYEAEKDIP